MAQEKTKPSWEEIQRSYFSQLRSLCRDVEKGIEDLKQEPSTNNITYSEDSVGARNMILHTTKELKDLKSEAQAQYKDFVIHSARFSRIQELMQDLFKVYWDRIETVELFIEKYGYKRPQNSNSDRLPCETVKERTESNNDELETDSSTIDAEDKVNTSPNKGENAKSSNPNLLTPDNSAAPSSSHRSALKTPEPPAFLSVYNQRKFDEAFKSNVVGEKSYGTNMCHSNTNFGKVPHLSTPETPEHIRTILIGSVTKMKPEARQFEAFPLTTPETPDNVRTIIGSMTKSKPDTNSLVPAPLSTPETPDSLRTIIGSMKKSKPDGKSALPAPLSTPETPDNIRTVIGSMKKSKPNVASAVPAPFSTPETPENVRTIIGSMKKSRPIIAGPADSDLSETNQHTFTEQDMFTSDPPHIVSLKADLSTPQTPENVRRILCAINGAVPVHEREFPEQPKSLQAFEQQHGMNHQVPKSRPGVRRNILPSP